ncbi:hypothetical protein PTSG_06318 [Salpingoeca rosetta]|uniref:AH domain-containing protein n=1 Tax=Salpingoeca rosetta (strain ATCC 50818 / BSB-021) TaxID=946362 RepID=F2UCK2_SALR5|nr:uncharacterized protein PTSG_06318 [Salpingoeca rosetta]EGD74309.1 hypothetical protein PTSG_06318 [Salpingoeca rosetta]|eukprot:XP_004993209.1 hypothetical protein PTSG_06318 [Salpingoeca rosetta]
MADDNKSNSSSSAHAARQAPATASASGASSSTAPRRGGAASLPPDLQLHGPNGELAAHSPVITAIFDAPSVIVVGGGAPRCPCVYVENLLAVIERDNEQPPLELGDEITMIDDQVTIGKTSDEVQQMLCSNNGKPVAVTYRKLPETLADTASKSRFHLKMMWSKLKQSMASKLSPQLRAKFKVEFASMHSVETQAYEAKVESVEQATSFYDGLIKHASAYVAKMQAFAVAAHNLGSGLRETTHNEHHDALRHKKELLASCLLADAESCQTTVDMVQYVCDHLKTFLHSVLTDAKKSLLAFKQCQDDFLAVSMRAFEMAKEQEEAAHRGTAVPEVQTGNYLYRHILRERGRLDARHSHLRDQMEHKMRLLVVENARDMATQLSRIVLALSNHYSKMAPTMAEAAQTMGTIGDNSAELCRAADIDTVLEPLSLDESANAATPGVHEPAGQQQEQQQQEQEETRAGEAASKEDVAGADHFAVGDSDDGDEGANGAQQDDSSK